MTLDELRPTLLSLIPDVTASGLTLAEIMNVIQRRLIAGKALDTHLNQITVRLKAMTGVDVTNVDDGLALAEAKIKTLAERLGTSNAREIELTRDLHEIKTRLATAGKESADLARALHLAEDKINGQSTRMGKLAGEVETLTRFRDDMRTVLGEPAATAKYMVDTVDEMRRDLTTIKNVLGMDRTVTTSDVLLQIGTQIKVLDRVRDAIGLRESAPMDYVVQRICDTRRDLHWAQGTLSMVSTALSSSHAVERTEIMARLSGLIKAQERFATLSNGLCDDLDMPTGDMDAVRRRVRDLVVFEQDVIKTMGGSDRDQVRDAIGVLQSEYKAQTDTFTILRQILGLGVGCAMTTIVAKVEDVIKTGHAHAQGEFAHLDMLNHVLGGDYALPVALDRATCKIKYMQAQTARLCKIVGNAETLHGAVDMVASLSSRVGKDDASAASVERRALIRFLAMAESTTWHEITNEVVRRISYTDGVLAGIGDSCQALGKIVGMDPTPALAVPALLALIERTTAIRDSLLVVVGRPGGETLSLNAALSLVQTKVSAVALSSGLSEYASLLVIKAGVENLRKARTITTLTTNQDAQIHDRVMIRKRLLTLLCEDPNRAGTMTTNEVVNLFKSKFACLAKNLSLPEDATLNTIMERIQNVIMDQFHGSAGAMPALRELVLTLHSTKAMDPNEAMTAAADKIKDLRQGLLDLLNAS